MSASIEVDFQTSLRVGRQLMLHLPDSQIAREAYDRAQDASEPWLFNHVVRSWFYGARLARQQSKTIDGEMLAVSILLHDLGLACGGAPDRRFEVVGADLARTFARDRGYDDVRAEAVWDAIALHGTGSVAVHKGPHSACCHLGVLCDYGGIGLEHFSASDQSAIISAYPRLAMKQQLTACLVGIVTRFPETTKDNFMADFGERYISGYQRPSVADLLHHAPFLE